MALIADGLLIAAALTAAIYCHVLAGRLRNLRKLDGGVGQAVAAMASQTDELRQALRAAKAAAGESTRTLAERTARAEMAAGRLELLLAAIQEGEGRGGVAMRRSAREAAAFTAAGAARARARSAAAGPQGLAQAWAEEEDDDALQPAMTGDAPVRRLFPDLPPEPGDGEGEDPDPDAAAFDEDLEDEEAALAEDEEGGDDADPESSASDRSDDVRSDDLPDDDPPDDDLPAGEASEPMAASEATAISGRRLFRIEVNPSDEAAEGEPVQRIPPSRPRGRGLGEGAASPDALRAAIQALAREAEE